MMFFFYRKAQWSNGYFFFFQAEDGILDFHVTGVQTCALPILPKAGNVNLAQPLLETTATTLNVAGSLVDVKGILSASDATNPFIFLDPTTVAATSLLATSGSGSMTAATTFVQDLEGTLALTGDAISVSNSSSLSGTGAAAFLALDGSAMTVTGNILTEKGAGSTATFKATLLAGANGASVT